MARPAPLSSAPLHRPNCVMMLWTTSRVEKAIASQSGRMEVSRSPAPVVRCASRTVPMEPRATLSVREPDPRSRRESSMSEAGTQLVSRCEVVIIIELV